MAEIKRMTVLNASVGADARQSPNEISTSSIYDLNPDCNTSEKKSKGGRDLSRVFDPRYLRTISMSELYETVYESKPPLIDGLLFPGTYLFVGAPKLGKSFFMAQLAYHISTGTPLWDMPTKKGTVLYLALEDDYGRLQKRLYRMFGTESTENLYFSVSAKQLGCGLDEQLGNFITEHPDTALIIIDTLQKVREVGGDNYSYASDYDIIASLKQLADRFGICLLLVHHTRKQQAEDQFDMISGTNGLLGAADGAFLLRKEKRTGNAATLDVSGRDQQDQRLYLERDTERLIWELEDIETELWKVPQEPLLEEIAKRITEDSPDWEGTATELVNLLGVDMKPNALSTKLNINASRLRNEYSIRYKRSRSHDGRKMELHLEQA